MLTKKGVNKLIVTGVLIAFILLLIIILILYGLSFEKEELEKGAPTDAEKVVCEDVDMAIKEAVCTSEGTINTKIENKKRELTGLRIMLEGSFGVYEYVFDKVITANSIENVLISYDPTITGTKISNILINPIVAFDDSTVTCEKEIKAKVKCEAEQ